MSTGDLVPYQQTSTVSQWEKKSRSFLFSFTGFWLNAEFKYLNNHFSCCCKTISQLCLIEYSSGILVLLVFIRSLVCHHLEATKCSFKSLPVKTCSSSPRWASEVKMLLCRLTYVQTYVGHSVFTFTAEGFHFFSVPITETILRGGPTSIVSDITKSLAVKSNFQKTQALHMHWEWLVWNWK